ncbi:type VI secretion system baseplate subunit TssE [Rugamonas sp. CCM 8940]|nr:type VI secretion system baseplate subunit TssE [Rugamonas sp. CCM 8940]MBJ7314337.1 type VI secretion system baseplate subunit TssE [Rugamonas sp. CCM 8940]
MDTYTAGPWDRLIGDPDDPASQDRGPQLTPEQYKSLIARDLEALLNTRTAIPDDLLASLPRCRRSIANFGLTDFAQLCLSSSEDRKEICDRLKLAIERHEPRLSKVKAQLIREAGVVNRLSFSISAVIRADAEADRVNFDLMLEPSSLRYAVR